MFILVRLVHKEILMDSCRLDNLEIRCVFVVWNLPSETQHFFNLALTELNRLFNFL